VSFAGRRDSESSSRTCFSGTQHGREVTGRICAEHSNGGTYRRQFPFPETVLGRFSHGSKMQIHLMTIASRLRLRKSQSKPIELDAGVNLRSKYDFIMYPEERKIKAGELR
jgi:hypothetical protein